MQRQFLQSEKGFSLVELMITMVVVVLALLGYIGGNMAVQQAGQAQFERSVAMQDANQVIEQMRNLAAVGTFPGNVTGTYPNNAQPGGFNNLTNEQITVTYVNSAADPLDVTVTVSWLENGTRPVSDRLRTLITQRRG